MSREPSASRLPACHALLLAFIILPLFINLHTPPLWDGSEPFYAETAREMLASGDWWTLHYNYRPRFEKPPLPVWVLAASYKLFGVNEWAARFPVALAAAAILLCLYFLGARLGTPQVGLLAAATTGTAFKFFGFARQYAGDVFLALSCVLALQLFVRWEHSNGARRWSLRAAGLVVGLGVLIKGPVGLFPALIGFAYLLARRRLGLVTLRVVLEGIVCVALVALPWYAYQVFLHGEDYVRVFLLEQNLARVVSSRLGARPLWFYGPALLGGALPGSMIFLFAVFDWLWHGDKQRWRMSPALLPALWFGLMLVFFSLARGKRDVYLLPLYPALGLLVGFYLDAALARGRRIVLAVSAAWLVLFALFIGGFGMLLWQWLETAWGLALAGVGATAAVAIAACTLKQRWAWAAAAGVTLLGVSLATATLALPHLANYRPVPQFAELIREQIQPNDRVATYLADLPSLMFYTRGAVESCWAAEEFLAVLSTAPRVYAVMPESAYEVLARNFPGHRWEVLATRPYLQLTRAHLDRLRRGQVGTPLVLVRIERLTP